MSLKIVEKLIWIMCKKCTWVTISQAITGLLAQQPCGKITVLFNYVSTYCNVYSLANRQGLFAYVRRCKTRLDTTTKYTVVVSSGFGGSVV